MSWHCSRALVVEYLGENSSDGELFARSKLPPTVHLYLPSDRMKEFSRLSRSGMTFAPLTEQSGKAVLRWFREDFLARTSAQPEQTQGNPEWASQEKSQDFGVKCEESSRKSNLDMFSQRTLLNCEQKGFQLSLMTFPPWGTIANGVYFPRSSLGQIMFAKECGSLLPTPTAHNAKEGAYPAEGTRKTPTLAWQLGGKINPEYTEWMMGWPIGWTDLKPSATDKFQSWQQKHSEFFHRDSLTDDNSSY